MNILHTVAPADFGGLEEVMIRLCRGLRRRGHRVTVVSVVAGSSGARSFTEVLRAEDVDVRVLDIPGRRYRHEISIVRETCEELRPDVVHTHGYRPDVLHRRAVQGTGVSLVTTLHGFTGAGLRNRLYEWLEIRAVRSFDAVVAVSASMAAALQAKGVSRSVLHVIQNAWSPRYELDSRAAARERFGVPPGQFHIGWVGRLSHEKGPDVFLAAMAHLHADGGVTASIVGDGSLRERLEVEAGSIEAASVGFHGAIPDAARLFSGFDAFVLSSRTEGTPMVLFEAMAASVPIVATRVGGVPDVLTSETALLVPPDDPEALALAIAAIRDEPSSAAARAARARMLLEERFSEGPWLDRYEALYSSLRRS